jgi:hypothetical protein
MLGPTLANLLNVSALLLTHACAGACWALAVVRRQTGSHNGSPEPWLQRARRGLFVLSTGLGVPVLGAWWFAFTTQNEPQAMWLNSAFGAIILVLVATPVLFVVCGAGWLFDPSMRTSRVLEMIAVGLAVAGIGLGGAIAAWIFHPGAWLEARSLRTILLSPATLLGSLARVSMAASMGGLAVMATAVRARTSNSREQLDSLGSYVLIAGLCAAGTTIGVWLWIGLGTATDPLLAVPSMSGVHGGRASRMATVAVMAILLWVTILAMHARARFATLTPAGLAALISICVLSIAAWEDARRSTLLPWSVPGLLYANGTSIEQVRTARRSPYFNVDLQHSREWTGSRMFELQCRSCHDASDPFRRSLRDRGFPHTRALLERLRDADQWGSDYRNVMPPLVGSDAEVDSLSRWLCGQP